MNADVVDRKVFASELQQLRQRLAPGPGVGVPSMEPHPAAPPAEETIRDRRLKGDTARAQKRERVVQEKAQRKRRGRRADDADDEDDDESDEETIEDHRTRLKVCMVMTSSPMC